MRGFRIVVAACAKALPPFEVASGAGKMESALVAFGSCVY